MQLKNIHLIPLTLLAIMVISITGFGQTNESLRPASVRIVGRVTDVTKAPIPNTKVTLKVPGIEKIVAEVRSDLDGHFSFQPIPAQVYEIGFEAVGFYRLILPAKRAAEGREYDVGIVTLTIAFMGDPVEVSIPPMITTLCDLVREGDHFRGEFVQLRAAVYPGGAGVAPRLVDSSCGANVGLHIPEGPSAAGKDLPLLRRYVEQHRVVMATVSGEYDLVPVYRGKPTYTLYLGAASDLVVTPTGVPSSPNKRR
jgi:hypothetical protein